MRRVKSARLPFLICPHSRTFAAQCVRFKKIDDVPLKVIGQAIKRVPCKKFIEHYESAIKDVAKRRPSKPGVKKATPRKKKGR